MRKRLFLLSILLLAGSIRGQDLPGPTNTLAFDTSKFQVTVTMDRAVYLPGEVARITFEVSNPGPATVAPKPFMSETGCVYRARKVGDDFQEPKDPLCVAYDLDSENTTTFVAGERKQVTLNSYDDLFDRQMPLLPGGAVPGVPGIFRLIYRYGASTAMAEYTVADPKLEAKAVARVNDELYDPFPGVAPPQELKEYVHVVALRLDGETYICVAQTPVNHDDFVFRHADGSFDPLGAQPLKRIATSRIPVVSLSATADSGENLTIEWVDAMGGRHRRYYSDGYPASRTRARKP